MIDVDASYPGTTTSGAPPTTNNATAAAPADRDANGAVPVNPEAASGSQAANRARLQDVLDIAGWVLAPTSIVTGALYWAGRNRTEGYWGALGVDQALLQFSTTDYVVRAVDTVFPLLVVVAIGTLLARQFHHVVRRRLCTRGRMWCLQTLKWALIVLGLASVTVTAARLFPALLFWLDPFLLAESAPLLPPILGLTGTSFLGYAAYLSGSHEISADGTVRLPRPSRIALALLTLLMILWAFWTAEQWAVLQGAEAARDASGYPTIVYSVAPLQLSGRGIEPLDIEPAGSGFQFGYSGLSLLRYSKGHYFLLNRAEQRVVILKESDQLRFEFERPTEGPAAGSPAQ